MKQFRNNHILFRARLLALCLCAGWIGAQAHSAAYGESNDETAAPLTPDRLYYQVDRPIPIQIKDDQAGVREVVLLTASNAEVTRATLDENARVADLAAMFPNLFDLREVHYAQLLINDAPTGAPLTLQPMVTRPSVVLKFKGRTPSVQGWNDPGSNAVMSGFRIYVESNVNLQTTAGDITIAMRPDHAPNTVWNFMDLAANGFYTHVPFHRVVAQAGNGHPFVIQAGDPSGTGGGGCAFNIDLEPSTLPHDLGVISMARQGHDVNTASSQFFLCLSRQGTSFLDVQYTSFGQTIEGIDVIQTLAAVQVGPGDRPLEMPLIQTASLQRAEPRVPGQPRSWYGADKKGENDANTMGGNDR